MRGIDRVLAVILLLGSVGGAAAFARHSGNDSTAPIVGLAAPPQQHVMDPGTVLMAPTPAPRRVKPVRVTIPQTTLRRPVHAVQPQRQVQPAEPKPTPPPVQAAPLAPAQTPEPPRALAVVQPAQPQAPVAPTVDIPVAPPSNDASGDQHGNNNDQHGNRNSNGDEHGQGSGQDQNGGENHSGD